MSTKYYPFSLCRRFCCGGISNRVISEVNHSEYHLPQLQWHIWDFSYFVALNSNANYGNAGRGDSVQIYRFRTAACFRFLPFFFLLKFRSTLAKQRDVSNDFDGNCSSKPQLREDTEFLFSVLTVYIFPYRVTYCSFTSKTNLCSLCIFHRLILIIALPSLRPMYR